MGIARYLNKGELSDFKKREEAGNISNVLNLSGRIYLM